MSKEYTNTLVPADINLVINEVLAEAFLSRMVPVILHPVGVAVGVRVGVGVRVAVEVGVGV